MLQTNEAPAGIDKHDFMVSLVITLLISPTDGYEVAPPNGERDEPPSAGGGNCVFMQFTVPADRALQSPKGVGSMELDRRSAFRGAYQAPSSHLAAPIGGLPKAVRLMPAEPRPAFWASAPAKVSPDAG